MLKLEGVMEIRIVRQLGIFLLIDTLGRFNPESILITLIVLV